MKEKTITVIDQTFTGKEIKCYEDEWLEFWLIGQLPKTKVFSVRSKCSQCELGIIKWYPQWRHYCFIYDDKVYSDRCLIEMGRFVQNLNKEHSKKAKVSGTQKTGRKDGN